MKRTSSDIVMLRLDEIELDSDNPRVNFAGEELRELSESLKTDGMIEPVVVRRNGQKYEVVVGERRARAAAYAGLSQIPSIVRNVSDEEASRLRLIENITRKDLDVFERVDGIKSHMSRFGLNVQEMGVVLHKSTATLQGWFKVAESTSPRMKASIKLRSIGLELLRELAKYNDETQEKLAEVIVDNGLIVHQARKLLNAFERKPTLSSVDELARKIKGEYKTVTITVPATRAKEIKRQLERAGRKQEHDKEKAKARLRKHLRPPRDVKSSKAPPAIRPVSPLESIKIPYEAKSTLEEIVTNPTRQLELAKLIEKENFDEGDVSYLASLAQREPRLSAKELFNRVIDESDRQGKLRFMVIELRPKLSEILKVESAKRGNEPKETIVSLASERLKQLGYKW